MVCNHHPQNRKHRGKDACGWGARLRAPDFQVDGGWDETEEEELVEEEVEFEEEAEEEIAGVGEEEVACQVS